jgi:beta-lactamase regulating signal transducer with metallopeptidase domain
MPQAVTQRFLYIPYASLAFQGNKKPTPDAFPSGFLSKSQQHPMEVSKMGDRPSTAQSSTSMKKFLTIICCAYFTVTTLLLVLFIRTRCRYWNIAKQGRPIRDPLVLEILSTWRRRFKIHRDVEVKMVASDVPTYTMGLFRPVIVLPEQRISSAGRDTLESIVAHELAHVKRWDDLAIYFQELVRIVYFFNPLVWFVISRLTWTREAVCDVTVLSHGTISPRKYGKQMLAFVSKQTLPRRPSQGLAGFTPAARGMAFRLNHIQKEDKMKSHPLRTFLAILVLGLFLLPMAPVVSSSHQDNTAKDVSVPEPMVQDQDDQQMTIDVLNRYIQQCVPCQNPEEVSRIIWGDLISENFQKEHYSRIVAATDCDIVDDIGDGQSAYVFYLLTSSRQGAYRPNYHFIKEQNKLILLFKSPNPSTYATDRSKVNGRYEIEEGWRADIFNGVNDDRISLAWASAVWFWSGNQYLKAYTEYTIKEATDPSLLGTRREWEKDIRSIYETAPRI